MEPPHDPISFFERDFSEDPVDHARPYRRTHDDKWSLQPLTVLLAEPGWKFARDPAIFWRLSQKMERRQ